MWDWEFAYSILPDLFEALLVTLQAVAGGMAIAAVSSTRSDLGATQNRLESAVRNLSVAAENLSASESRIRDADGSR
jgi:flagellin-like hook-associated protein FlgL